MPQGARLRTFAAVLVTALWVILQGFLLTQIDNAQAGLLTDFVGNPVMAMVPRVAWEDYIALIALSGGIVWVFSEQFIPHSASGSVVPLWASAATLSLFLLLSLGGAHVRLVEASESQQPFLMLWLTQKSLPLVTASGLGLIISCAVWRTTAMRRRKRRETSAS